MNDKRIKQLEEQVLAIQADIKACKEPKMFP